ncbi:hypothetical protein ZWY2020_022885 [Hordeum vulgare]|nr:hypothetical protein ZWY2020_022885 [Hordeum vulgare]
MARCVCAEALLRRLPAAAASGRAGGAQIWAAQARLGPSQPLYPHPPFSLLPPLPATAGGCRWVVHARGDPDGCCDAVPRRIPAAEAAGRRGAGDRCRLLDALPVVAGLLALRWPVPKPVTTDVPRLPAPCASVFSNVLRHVRSASASEGFNLADMDGLLEISLSKIWEIHFLQGYESFDNATQSSSASPCAAISRDATNDNGVTVLRKVCLTPGMQFHATKEGCPDLFPIKTVKTKKPSRFMVWM